MSSPPGVLKQVFHGKGGPLSGDNHQEANPLPRKKWAHAHRDVKKQSFEFSWGLTAKKEVASSESRLLTSQHAEILFQIYLFPT